MELVRDVVKTMEEGMMESFDDETSKPISSVFSAPIPNTLIVNKERPRSASPTRSFSPTRAISPNSPFWDQRFDDEQFPVMEAMSHDAILEMVEKTFQAAAGGKNVLGLDLEEFRIVVETDCNMLAWFEALGSVF